jgi:hypothetical protein
VLPAQLFFVGSVYCLYDYLTITTCNESDQSTVIVKCDLCAIYSNIGSACLYLNSQYGDCTLSSDSCSKSIAVVDRLCFLLSFVLTLHAMTDAQTRKGRSGGTAPDPSAPSNNRADPLNNRAGPSNNRAGPTNNRAGSSSNGAGPSNNRAGPSANSVAPSTTSEAPPATSVTPPVTSFDLCYPSYDLCCPSCDLYCPSYDLCYPSCDLCCY